MDTSVSSTACSGATSTPAATYVNQLNALMSTLASVHPESASRGSGSAGDAGAGAGAGGGGGALGAGASSGELVVGRVTGADIEEAACAGTGWRALELPRDALPLFGFTRTCTCGSADAHAVQGEPAFRYSNSFTRLLKLRVTEYELLIAINSLIVTRLEQINDSDKS